jgi:tetratricopeptide (TPR) repeat protein
MELETERKPRFSLQEPSQNFVENAQTKVQIFRDLEEAFRVFDEIDELPIATEALPPIPPESQISGYLLRNALLLIDSGEFALARNVLGDLLRRDSNHVDAIRWMGWCFKAEGELHNAEKCYEQLTQRRCTEQDLFELGEIYYELKKDSAAQSMWLEALGQCDAESPRLFDLHKCLGNVFMRQSDFESAEENYNKAMVLKPSSDVLNVNFGSLQIQLKNPLKAMNYFKKAIEINSFNDRAWCGVALVDRERNDIEWSRAVLLRSLDINPYNLTALQVLVNWSQQDNNFEAAIERVQKYLDIYQNDVDMSYSLAGLLFQNGDLNQAEVEIIKVEAMQFDYQGIQDLKNLIVKKKLLAAPKSENLGARA